MKKMRMDEDPLYEAQLTEVEAYPKTSYSRSKKGVRKRYYPIPDLLNNMQE
jgi:hypothetical protein